MKKIKEISNAYGSVVVCFVFMMFFFIYGCIHKQQSFSDTENRQLQQIPEGSFASFLDTSLQKDMETYVSDQFYKRQYFVKMKSNIERKIGKVAFQDVYVGKDNILFQKRVVPKTSTMKDLADALHTFKATHTSIQVSMMLVPNKSTIWEDKLPWSVVDQNQQKDIEYMHSLLDKKITWIDTLNALNQHKEEYIYYHNDHHWTTLGASYAFEAWSTQKLKNTKKVSYTIEPIQPSFYGSLSKQSGNYQGDADVVSIPVMKDIDYVVDYVQEQKKATSLYDMQKVDTKNPYDVFLEGNHPLLTIETTSKGKGNLLIIKDSYANSFIPFLLPYYRSITVVDPRYYVDDLETLLSDRDIQEVLFLYNANTFFQDTSLYDMLEMHKKRC